MREYEVVMVGECDLPQGVDWFIAERHNGNLVAFLKQSRICADMLQEAWAAAAEIDQLPRQRVSVP